MVLSAFRSPVRRLAMLTFEQLSSLLNRLGQAWGDNNMQTLDDLKILYDEDKLDPGFDYEFVESLLIMSEEGRPFTQKQFAKLVELDQKYYGSGKHQRPFR